MARSFKPLADQTAESVARAVVDNFISRFGCPLQIHTHQGTNFTGSLFTAICTLLEIAKTRTTPYRPCSNGQVERYNRTLLQLIRCHLKENVTDWDKDLPILAGAIRSLPNRTTGLTRNLMMLGREVFSFTEGNVQNEQPTEYVQNLKERMTRVHSLARDKIGVA